MAKRADAVDLDRDFEVYLGGAGMRTVIDWVAAKSLWVDPRVVAEVPVVFPKTRRKHHDEKRGDIIDGIRVGTNVPAQHAFWYARNEDWRDYSHQYVCHLYDSSPYIPEHNTHLANLCVFPRGIQSMSEWGPVQAVLHWHAWELYRYTGPTGDAPAEPEYYPSNWPGVPHQGEGELEKIVARLKHLRENRPMHTSPADPGATKMGEVQSAILEVLRAAPNGLSHKEVASAINKELPQTYQTLAKLVDQGRVQRRENPLRPAGVLYVAGDVPSETED